MPPGIGLVSPLPAPLVPAYVRFGFACAPPRAGRNGGRKSMNHWTRLARSTHDSLFAGRIRRSVFVLGATCALMLAFAASALADAPDPVIAVPPTIPSPIHSKVTFDQAGNTVVQVWGGRWNGDPDTNSGNPIYNNTQPGQVLEIGWQWTTHNSDCNNDRTGAGVAMDWSDPSGTILTNGS